MGLNKLDSKKVFFVTNVPTPYRIPLFNTIAVRLKESGYCFQVAFYSQLQKWKRMHSRWLSPRGTMIDLLDKAKFDYLELKTLELHFGYEHIVSLPSDLLDVLYAQKPLAIITGGFSFNSIMILLYSKMKRIPYIIFSGAVPWAPRKSLLRYLVRKVLIKHASAFIAYGSCAKKYLVALGADMHNIFVAFNTVNTDYFSEGVSRRRERNLTDQKYFLAAYNILYIGQVTSRKGMIYLWRAVKIIMKDIESFKLYVVGSGPQENYLKSYADELGIEKHIEFCGFKQPEELLQFYAQCDLFIFPSLYDPWGLVLNEAMAAGLPVIASKYAGATYDLVQDGVNGFVVDPHNIDEMAKKIKILFENPELRRQMGENAQTTVLERFTLEKSAQGFVDAIMRALRGPTHA